MSLSVACACLLLAFGLVSITAALEHGLRRRYA